MAKLQDIITSRVRVKLLELFFTNPDGLYYIREATRAVNEEINAVRRELLHLTKSGALFSENRGNRQYYGVNKGYVFFPEIQAIVFKETGLGKKIRRLRRKLGNLHYVVFTPHYFNRARTSEGLDLLIIGEVVVPELEVLLKEEEKRLEREINFTIFDEKEFKFRKQRRDPFIMDVLYGRRLMIIGDEEAFVERGQFL
jgi:hypothetical protein